MRAIGRERDLAAREPKKEDRVRYLLNTRFMSSSMAIAGLMSAAVLFSGCISQSSGPATRSTPAGTIESFKKAAARGDRRAEWDILSPNFKKRLSRQAGRNVDLADYITARNALRSDPQVRLAESMLKTAKVQRTEMQGENSAYLTITAGPLGVKKTARIHMVRMQRWELHVAGDDEPYSGIVGDSSSTYRRNADGGYTVSGSGGFSETFRRDEIRDFKTSTKWYVDDLGGMERQFMQ